MYATNVICLCLTSSSTCRKCCVYKLYLHEYVCDIFEHVDLCELTCTCHVEIQLTVEDRPASIEMMNPRQHTATHCQNTALMCVYYI